MKQITINETNYNALLNVRAAKTYQELTGKDISTLSGVADTGALIYACIDAAAKREKVKTPITYDDVLDNLELDKLDSIVDALMPKVQGE